MDSNTIFWMSLVWSVPVIVGLLCLIGAFEGPNDKPVTLEQVLELLGYSMKDYLTNDRVFEEVQFNYDRIMNQRNANRQQARNALMTGLSVGTSLYTISKLNAVEKELKELKSKKA